jgi:hypothetical protein
MHLVARYTDRIGVARRSLKRRLRRHAIPDQRPAEHLHQHGSAKAGDSDLEREPQDFWRDTLRSAPWYWHH